MQPKSATLLTMIDGDVDDDDSAWWGLKRLDHDGDTFGDSTYPMQACNQPSGYVVIDRL